MKFKTKKLSIAEIAIVSSEVEDREIIYELSKLIGADSLEVVLALHPVVLHEIAPNNYRIISGEPQLRLARALFGKNFVISVQILSNNDDSETAFLIESLIAPLLLSVSSSELRQRAQTARKGQKIHSLGRNFHLNSTWDLLLNQSRDKRVYKRKDSKPRTQIEPGAL